jgi:phosphoglycerol transferase
MVPSIAGPDRAGETMRAASRFTFAALLLSTLGGFGSLINLLVVPDIQAYTRITPFIAFFALAAVALWTSRAMTGRRWIGGAVVAAIVAVGLLDQLVAVRPLNANRTAADLDFSRLRGFVAHLEQQLPAGAMVFQLPVRPFPLKVGIWRMGSYDHFAPYLVSRTLRWSYPALSETQVRWQDTALGLDPQKLPAYLAREGFAAILVDRYGYEDSGDALIAALQSAPGQAPVAGHTDRYLALDVRAADGSAR